MYFLKEPIDRVESDHIELKAKVYLFIRGKRPSKLIIYIKEERI